MADLNDRELKNTLQQIEKQFGKGSIMQASAARAAAEAWEGISTGALNLDIAAPAGGRGLPRGRIVEIFGPEGEQQDERSQLHAVAGPRRPAASRLTSTRSTLSIPAWMKRIGVDLERPARQPAVERGRGGSRSPKCW